jgi:hypothetical protein
MKFHHYEKKKKNHYKKEEDEISWFGLSVKSQILK